MLPPKVVSVEAGSEQWQSLRRRRLTASAMTNVLAGKETRKYRDYQAQIVQELLGIDDPEESGPWFEHGKVMEPYARGAYEWKTGIELTPDVMFIHPEYDWISASPDGVPYHDFPSDEVPAGSMVLCEPAEGLKRVLYIDKGIVEIKCRAPHECVDKHGFPRKCGGCNEPMRNYLHAVREIEYKGRIDSIYRPQVQAQCWIAGVPEILFINYYHDHEQRVRKLHVAPVARDDAYIARLEERCLEFMIECYKLANKDPSRIAA